MPTDHACHAAATAAARGIAPVRDLLAPLPPPAAPRPDPGLPVVLRQYYGIEEEPEPIAEPSTEPEPVSTPMGGVVLLAFLDGLHAELRGALLGWYAELSVRVPHAVGAPAAGATESQPPEEPNAWRVMNDLSTSVEELLTVLVDRPSEDRVGELTRRLALVEDVFAGSLRRLDIPGDTAVQSAAGVAGAAGALFGIRR